MARQPRPCLLADLTPLRVSRDYRLLFTGNAVSYLGRQLTVVAIPFQVFTITGSSLVVGVIGLATVVPLVTLSLAGGAIADAVDRRKLLLLNPARLRGHQRRPGPPILQLSVPDALRGRLSSVHIAVVTGGPQVGDAEAGAVAAITSPRFSVVSGGLACILGVAALVRWVPELARYDALAETRRSDG